MKRDMSPAETRNRNIIVCTAVFTLFVLILIVYFCIASLITSFGYEQAMAAGKSDSVSAGSFKNGITVVIDPGHGGEDPGAVCEGVEEKTVNLAIAAYLNDFMSLSGADVVMTRKEDRLLYESGEEARKKAADLRNRLRLAESYDNAVYVGIHANKFPDASCSGLQTFYSDNNESSRVLASSVQELCRMADEKNHRKIKPDGNTIYILENISSPAVLIECGFLSNERDRSHLTDESYRKKLAFLIYCGIEQYICLPEK